MNLLNQPIRSPKGEPVRLPSLMVPMEAIMVCHENIPPGIKETTVDSRNQPHRLMPHQGTLILVLGIVSFFTLPFILGPIAWIMGSSNLAAMRAGRMDSSGAELTNAGRVCGMISTILGIVALVFVLGMTILLMSTFRSIK